MNIIQGKLNFFSLFKRNFLYRLKSKINIDNHPDFKEKSIDDLFSYYNCDKANFTSEGKNKSHGYSKFYEKHFHSLKNKKINILEIGSYAGASAAAFAKYFPNAEIFCLDINLRSFKFSSKRFHVFGIDAVNYKMMLKFLNKIDFFNKVQYFDIIIDDGSHDLSDQLKALNYYYKYVKPGGYYVIEEYKFSNYFDHLNTNEDLNVEELINKVNKKEFFASKLIEKDTINLFLKKSKSIFTYKGNTRISDIAFFETNVD